MTLRGVDLTAIPLHPLLAAAYPVVFLFAANADEQVTLEPMWGPLSVAVGATAAVFALVWLALRDGWRAGLLTTIGVIGFFGYGHVFNAIWTWLPSQWPFVVGWLLVVALALAGAFRVPRRVLPTVTRALNVVAGLALLLNAGSVAGTMVAIGAVEATDRELTDLELAPPDRDDLPDVYYLVFDRYAGSTALAQTYGYDNEPFLTALEERGFAVARHAHANYAKTPLSLVSSLNMDYLDLEALRAQADDAKDREPIHRALRDHLVVPSALKELGYRYLHVANWWAPSATNVDADRVFRYEGQTEFSSALWQTTLMRAINDPQAAALDPYDWPVLRQHSLYELATLEEIPSLPGPKYVFAHMLLPHDPYVFNPDGSPTTREQVAEQGEAESYRRQLTYLNGRILDLVDRITAASPDAVILLQADEGPFPPRYRADEWNFNWHDATDEELEQKFGILYAMRVPGADVEEHGFHDAITPVNAFRVIFNARFGTDFRMLPDRVYAHSDQYHFFDSFEITDRLQY